VKRAGEEMDVTGWPGLIGDKAREVLRFLARPGAGPRGQLEIVRRAAAVVGTLSEDLGLVSSGSGTIRETSNCAIAP